MKANGLRLNFSKYAPKQKVMSKLLVSGVALAGASLYWYLQEDKEAASKYHGVVIFGVCGISGLFSICLLLCFFDSEQFTDFALSTSSTYLV